MLRVRDLRVAYDHPVLRGINVEVGDGEIVCILGPSGGGKSTLLRAVAGLVDYDGSISVAGRSLDGVPAHRRGVGMMFQDAVLFPHLDVTANVGFGVRPPDPDRVAQMLRLVDMADFGQRSPETLSGGQAQRVALARALAPAPDVLLLDEPFGALDAVLKSELVLQVQRLLREQGVTVLAVTHDRDEAFTMADRIAILRDGRLVQVGTPDELWRAPADTYVARLVGLSVIDGTAYVPEDLHEHPDGPWLMTVTGSTFRQGRRLVSGTVDDEPVSYIASGAAPQAGNQVRLAARQA